MQIHCKRCSTLIEADAINLERQLAKCARCHSVFSFATESSGSSKKGPPPPRSRGEVPIPSSMRIEDTGSGLRITRRWFHPMFFFLIFFCVIWNGFLVFFFSMMTAQDDVPLVVVFFPLGHVAVGIGLAYYTVAGFLNRTEIHADGYELSVRHTPVPWPGNVTILAADIDQIFCEEKRHRGKHGYSYSYRVNAVRKDPTRPDGRKVKLVSGLKDVDQALFLESRLESFLDIEDRAVAGELRR